MTKWTHRLTTILWMMTVLSVASAVMAETPLQNTVKVESGAFMLLRDPFWPVGYEPVSETEQIEKSKIAEVESRIKWPSLKLRGVTYTGKTFIAIIDGIGLVEAGDIISISENALTYRWQIDKITETGITSTRLDVTASADNLSSKTN